MSKHDLIKQVQDRTGTTDTGAVNVTVKDLPIGNIVSRKNVRVSDDIKIDTLKASIKADGLIQPITVYKDGDEYVTITGHRRLRAMRALQAEEPDRFHSIRCIVADNKKITRLQVTENRQRVNLDQVELYHSFKDLKNQGLTYKQIAEVADMSEGSVKNIFAGIIEVDADPENMSILKKSPGVTLKDFQTVKAVKDKTVKQKLLKAKAEKKITRDELQHKAMTHKHKLESSKSVFMDLNGGKLTIKITFKEKHTFHKIAAGLKALLKKHNISA